MEISDVSRVFWSPRDKFGVIATVGRFLDVNPHRLELTAMYELPDGIEPIIIRPGWSTSTAFRYRIPLGARCNHCGQRLDMPRKGAPYIKDLVYSDDGKNMYPNGGLTLLVTVNLRKMAISVAGSLCSMSEVFRKNGSLLYAKSRTILGQTAEVPLSLGPTGTEMYFLQDGQTVGAVDVHFSDVLNKIGHHGTVHYLRG